MKYLFHKKNRPQVTKIVTLSVVGLVFLSVLIFSIWNQYYADTLIKYAPDDAIVYAHFSLPKYKSSDVFNQIFKEILIDNNLPNFQFRHLERELAVIGQIKDNQLVFSMIVRTSHPFSFKMFLEREGIDYQVLDRSRILISPINNVADFVKNRKNQIAVQTKDKFSHFNSLNIFVSPVVSDYLGQDLLFDVMSNLLADENGNLYLNFQIKKGGIKVFPSLLSQDVNEYHVDFTKGSYDLIISSSNLNQTLSNWENQLESQSVDDFFVWQDYLQIFEDTYLIKEILNNSILFLTRRNQNNNDWFMRDYDFYLRFDNKISEAGIKRIENIFKDIFARQFPVEKNVLLSDDTIVKELVPDPSQFKFISLSSDNIFAMLSPDQRTAVYYRIEDNGLAVSNNRDVLNTDFGQSAGDYIILKTNFFPLPGILGKYLNNFQTIQTGNKGLILR